VIFEIDPSAGGGSQAAITQLAVPGPARLKVLDPIATTGPSSQAEILSASEFALRVRTGRRVLPGSKVQVRTNTRIMFGEVLAAIERDGKFDIVVEIQRT
jgi:hypothetical protein